MANMKKLADSVDSKMAALCPPQNMTLNKTAPLCTYSRLTSTQVKDMVLFQQDGKNLFYDLNYFEPDLVYEVLSELIFVIVMALTM